MGEGPAVDADAELQGVPDGIFFGTCCSWCKDHNRALYGKRIPLCASCAAIQRRIRKYERLARKYPRKSTRSFDLYGYELAAAKHNLPYDWHDSRPKPGS